MKISRRCAGLPAFSMTVLLFPLLVLACNVAAMRARISPEDSLRLAQAQDSTKALAYAPILWFASGEKYFPTIPFYTAFEWNQEHASGLQLTAEMIRPERSWRGLLEAYDADSLARREVWVFWDKDKRGVSVRDFQKLLESDRQFRRRGAEYFLRLRNEVERIEVFRYWLYYLNDTGLEGHPQDIEFVYVFVPVWREGAPRDKKISNTPLAVVGAGHTEMVPNNVLLCDTPLDAIVILTELGGHASAPDRDEDGNFNPGYDANWQAANLWGTRDTQASAGLGAFGNYEAWMTFPRKPGYRCFPPQEKFQKDWHYRLVWAEDLKRLYDGILALPAHRELLTAADSVQWLSFGAQYEKLGGPLKESWLRMEQQCRAELYHRLRDWHKDQWTYKRNALTDSLEKVEHKKLAAAKHMPWRHGYYNGSASKIFKRGIFPPTGNFDHWLRGGYLRYAGRRETSGGLILHVTEPPLVRDLFKLSGVVVLETGYRWVAKDTSEKKPNETTQDYLARVRGTDQIAVRLLYDVTYNTLFTGYFGWGVETDRKHSDFNSTRKFFYGGVKAEYRLERLPAGFNFLQLRLGVRIPNYGHKLRANNTVLDLQASLHR
jgi:hypothetical protein